MQIIEKNSGFKNIEIRSQEVNEVMNKIPPVILRWGNTLLVIIVGGLILACCFIKWPETEFTTFRWQWDADKKIPSIYINIPANSLKNILSDKDKKISLSSEIFGDTENHLTGKIDKINPHPKANGYYSGKIILDDSKAYNLIPYPIEIEGTAFYIKSEIPIIYMIFKNLKFNIFKIDENN